MIKPPGKVAWVWSSSRSDRDGLGAVLDDLAAFEQAAHQGVELELLEFPVRVDERVAVVEADQLTHGHHVVLHAIDEAAAEGVALQRIAKGVDDLARLEPGLGELPYFLDADLERRRVLALVQAEIAQ